MDERPEITVKELRKSKTYLEVGITEENRKRLWHELCDMLNIYKHKGKNKERSFTSQFPIVWELITKIRIKE